MKPAPNVLLRLLPLLRGDLPFYLAAVAVAPFSAALVVAQPWLLKRAIDEGIVPGDLGALSRLCLAYLATVIAAFVLEGAYTLSISWGAMRTIARVRDRVFAHTLSLAPSYFDHEPTGRLLTRATSDVEALGETLTAGAVTIVLDVILVLGILIAMFALDPRLTGVLLLCSPLLALAVDRIRRVLRQLYTQVRTALAELNAFTAERLGGLQVLQLYSAEAHALAGYDRRLRRYRDTTIRTNIWDAGLYALVDGLGTVSMALMLWYGSGGMLQGVVTAGLLVAFLDYVTKLFRPIQEFSQKVAVLQRAAAALDKIFSLLDVVEQIPDGNLTPTAPPRGTILLRDVRFAYEGGPDVLCGVDLEVAPGEVVAIVGRTGSGKTTLGKLLTRAYHGHRGDLLIDGLPLDDLPVAWLRAGIGMVRQDVQLFPADVRFNLTLGHEISDSQLWRAIERVQAIEVVEALGGLDGWIAHDGANLSAGQAQLISFARVMAHDPPIIVLDEATASVDTLTEARIQRATAEVLAHKTVLVIAHRLSTIIHADRIALLDAGVVIEVGSHSALMAGDGAYAKLFRQQFSAPDSHAAVLPSAR